MMLYFTTASAKWHRHALAVYIYKIRTTEGFFVNSGEQKVGGKGNLPFFFILS